MSERMKLSPAEKSRLAKISNTGENNPSFGTIWITDGNINRKLKVGENMPLGWYAGRTICSSHAEKFSKRNKCGKNNPRYNHTTYEFRNVLTGECKSLTPNEFAMLYGINIKKVRGLFKKRINRLGDWVID